MATKIIDNNGIVSFDSISSEEDLKLSPRININPPPGDGRCMCCGRHISELEPFGKAGDPLVGNFEGAVLVKTFRSDFSPDEEAIDAYEKALNLYKSEGYNNPLDWMKLEYGKDEGESLYESALCGGVGKSWECRDCIVLDQHEYFKKLFEQYSEEETETQHHNEDYDILDELDSIP